MSILSIILLCAVGTLAVVVLLMLGAFVMPYVLGGLSSWSASSKAGSGGTTGAGSSASVADSVVPSSSCCKVS